MELVAAELAEYNKIVRDILDEMAVINENEGMLADGSWIRRKIFRYNRKNG